MRRTSVFVLLTAALLTFGIPWPGSAAEPAFTVEVDPQFHRPLVRRYPPQDDDEHLPLEVVQQFLRAINEEDYDVAAKDCLFGEPALGKERESVAGEAFRTFCKKVRGLIKRVTLSGSTIPSSSSSIVYSKGKYWNVYYKHEPAEPGREQGYFCLLQVDGAWKILEKPHWHSVATGKDRSPKW